MNIFKVLASGDGSIKEPNLSAFLGYLLNPKADHGLNDTFLKKALEPFLKNVNNTNPLKELFSSSDKNSKEDLYILDLGVNTHFNVEVVLEKAFKNLNPDASKRRSNTKTIVDIFIKITKRKQSGNEDVSYLFNKEEEPVALILVENKINKDNKVIAQLTDQYNNSLDYLPNQIINEQEVKIWKKSICTVLITPDQKDLSSKFDSFKTINENSIFLTWQNEFDEGSHSIKTIIRDILNEHSDGTIAPISSYTADTLRALVNFIENDFSSDADDQQRGGKQIAKYYNSVNDAIEYGDGLFSTMPGQMQQRIRQIDDQINISITDGLVPKYTKERIAVEFNGRIIWNIEQQSDVAFIICYFDTPAFFPQIDVQHKLPNNRQAYKRRDIQANDESSIDIAMDYLKRAIEIASAN